MKDPERLNYVRFNESGETFEGNIASLEFDEDIRGVKLESSNIGAPAYRVYGKTQKDQEVEIGAVWRRKNDQGQEYLQMSVHMRGRTVRANLGKYPGETDDSLMSVIFLRD
ncbi:DUF736 domain-containing protein [Martelella soudanensis]|uniref:DUF736 domain-containing protein n=1 Tax=unclassified Martelella TaxID=2629616 RepID=UPI0015DE8EE9|nr:MULTISPECIES: DUF736 family protein [unclassified Martelella]